MRRLLAEAQILGGKVWLPPVLLVACLAVLLIGLGEMPGMQPMRVFLAWFGGHGLLPLLAAMLATQSASTGSIRELHATLPTAFRCVLLMRFALIAGIHLLGCIALAVLALVLHTSFRTVGGISVPMNAAADLGGCLITLAWCATVGWCAGILLHSTAAGRVVLVCAWLSLVASSAMELSPERWWLLQTSLFISGGLGIWLIWYSLREPVKTWPTQGEWE